jgi:hypothetical protein
MRAPCARRKAHTSRANFYLSFGRGRLLTHFHVIMHSLRGRASKPISMVMAQAKRKGMMGMGSMSASNSANTAPTPAQSLLPIPLSTDQGASHVEPCSPFPTLSTPPIHSRRQRIAVPMAWEWLRRNRVPVFLESTMADLAVALATGAAEHRDLLAWFHLYQEDAPLH